MNWFVTEPVSVDSLLQTGLPFLEFLGVLVGIVAVLMLLVALLHTIFAVRSPNSHLELHRFGEAKRRADAVLSPPAPPRKRLVQVAHFRSWLFTR